jgi:Kef-type K+ transport system membrane component KefB
VWSTSDPVSRLALYVAVILVAAKLGAKLASRLKQPAVLGELVVGIALGSLSLSFFRDLRTDAGIDMLARLGVLVLLFEVGLESTVHEVMRVGIGSMRVAVLGTVGTLLAGLVAARLAMPGSGTLVHVFVAAAITATSVGVSARVLKDASASRSPEAHTILGAAVLDDVLGLVVLSIVTTAVVHAGVSAVTPGEVVWLVAKTLAFLALALLAGVKLSPKIFRVTARLRTSGALLAAGLSLCFVLAWASDIVASAILLLRSAPRSRRRLPAPSEWDEARSQLAPARPPYSSSRMSRPAATASRTASMTDGQTARNERRRDASPVATTARSRRSPSRALACSVNARTW